jgi:hypothetical protein
MHFVRVTNKESPPAEIILKSAPIFCTWSSRCQYYSKRPSLHYVEIHCNTVQHLKVVPLLSTQAFIRYRPPLKGSLLLATNSDKGNEPRIGFASITNSKPVIKKSFTLSTSTVKSSLAENSGSIQLFCNIIWNLSKFGCFRVYYVSGLHHKTL